MFLTEIRVQCNNILLQLYDNPNIIQYNLNASFIKVIRIQTAKLGLFHEKNLSAKPCPNKDAKGFMMTIIVITND